MKKSIGILEFKSIAKGIEATDVMLKSADVELILASPLCPGKYITIISGEVGAVYIAVEAGKLAGCEFALEGHVISNVSEAVFPALTGTARIDRLASLGIIETMTAVSSVIAGDIAVKASSVTLIDIRLARGLGGKGFVLLTGEVASVNTAIRACEEKLKQEGTIVATSVIASPSKAILSELQ
ncbi:MAG: BMC domain-containing protein [Bacillota bacterium]